MRMMLLVLTVLGVGGCGSGVVAPDTTENPATSSTTFAAPSTSGAPAGSPSTSTAGPTTTVAKVDYEFSAGVGSGPDRFEYTRGDVVDLWIVADVNDELHVHGYDVFVTLEAGSARNLRFVADIPGVFEVELESAHIALFDIEVSG